MNANQSLGCQMWWPPIQESAEGSPDSGTKEFSYPVDATLFASHIPHFKSKGNVESLSGEREIGMRFLESVYYSRDKGTAYQKESQIERTEFPAKGPTRQQSLSPIGSLEDFDENCVVDLQPSQLRGSRSPHKKLFGENGWLGRSMSMKEFPAEKYKKPGLKMLGEKIKQRVEDIVSVLEIQSLRVEFPAFPLTNMGRRQEKL
jgi:hypothetical protein